MTIRPIFFLLVPFILQSCKKRCDVPTDIFKNKSGEFESWYYGKKSATSPLQTQERKLLDSIGKLDSLNKGTKGIAYRIGILKESYPQSFYYLDFRDSASDGIDCRLVSLKGEIYDRGNSGHKAFRHILKIRKKIKLKDSISCVFSELKRKGLFGIKDFSMIHQYKDEDTESGVSLFVETADKLNYKIISLPHVELNSDNRKVGVITSFLKEIITYGKIDELGFVLVQLN